MKALGASIALLLTAIVYWPMRSAGWVYEDGLILHSTHAPVSRALTALTWTQTPSPISAHLFSLGLHLCVAGLLWLLLMRLSVSVHAAYAATLVWLLHPLNVEAVAYAAQRGELLSAIGILIACLAVLEDGRVLPWIGLAAGCLFAALSKESGLVALPLAALIRAAVPAQNRLAPNLLWSAVGLVAMIAIGWFGGIRTVVNYGATDFVNALSITWWQWLLIQAAAVHHWIGSAIWLTGFTPDADIDAIPVALRIFSAILIAVLASGIYLYRRTAPLVALGLAWGVVALLPRFIVQTPQGYLNAHQMYVPMIGATLIAAHGFSALCSWAETA